MPSRTFSLGDPKNVLSSTSFFLERTDSIPLETSSCELNSNLEDCTSCFKLKEQINFLTQKNKELESKIVDLEKQLKNKSNTIAKLYDENKNLCIQIHQKDDKDMF